VKDWYELSFGDVCKGDIVDTANGAFTVTGIGHSDKPGGSVVINLSGTRPLRGNPTESISVYR